MERKIIVTLKDGIFFNSGTDYNVKENLAVIDKINCDAVVCDNMTNGSYYEIKIDKDILIIPAHNILGMYVNPKFNQDGNGQQTAGQ